jgi:hypothetical protein
LLFTCFYPLSESRAQDKLDIPKTQVDSIQLLKEFRYANDPAYWIRPRPEPIDERVGWLEYLLQSGWVKGIFYLLLVLLLSFVLYRIFKEKNLLLFARKASSRKRVTTAAGSQAAPDIDQLLSQAEGAGDFQESVRLQFLKTLFLLRNKGLVEYHPEWTNAHYLQQLRTHRQADQFRQLSRIYEYVCYGGFATTSEKYQLIKQEFSRFRQLV